MTIIRANAANWGTGTQLTSGQANQIDLNTTYALDKRGGQTDSLQSVVTCASGGRIVGCLATGADADATVTVAGGTLIDIPTLTATRTYTLSNSGAVSGDMVLISVRATANAVIVKNASGTTLTTIGASAASTGTWGEFLFTGAAWVLTAATGALGIAPLSILTTGTFTVPAGVRALACWGYGGGGAGGAGNPGVATALYLVMQGSGGGGSLSATKIVACAPGDVVSVTIGAGGTPNPNARGSDGGATTITTSLGTATWAGAQGGNYDSAAVSVAAYANQMIYLPGGGPVSQAGYTVPKSLIITSNLIVAGRWPDNGFAPIGFSQGGCAIAGNTGGPSGSSPDGQIGSPSGGNAGAYTSNFSGGGGGGSGGSGPGGPGGNGGLGGNATNGGVGTAAGNGGAAAVNSGAGGAGGAAGGSGTAGGGAGAPGTTGGSGMLLVGFIH